LPRTASDIPVNPVRAEKPAPTKKKTERPHCTAEEDDHHEHAEGPELAAQVGSRAFLHSQGDLLHLLGALAGREHLPHQQPGHAEREQGDDRDDHNPGQVGASHADGVRRERREKPCHSTSWNPNGMTADRD
jgi:hypothetical protein